MKTISKRTALIIALCAGIVISLAVLIILGMRFVTPMHTDAHEATPAQSTDSVEAPSLTSVPSTTITADRPMARKLSDAGQKAQDTWYLATVRNASVEDTTPKLLDMRSKVCAHMKQDPTLDTTNEYLIDEGFDEEQQGVIIGASMVAQCPDVQAVVPATTEAQK